MVQSPNGISESISDPNVMERENEKWDHNIQEIDGVKLALVPAGCFDMGYEAEYENEAPVHQICIEKPFWIDQTEITNFQYAKFLNDKIASEEEYMGWIDIWPGYSREIISQNGKWRAENGKENRPVSSLTWFGAIEYCEWRNGRLPTEAEWEYAARGPDSLLYPWGEDLIEENVVRIIQKVPDLRIPDVGSKPNGASWVGALDMSSSLMEWVNSIYIEYPYDPTDGRETGREDDSKGERVLRGGSWYHNISGSDVKDRITATARFRNVPNLAHWSSGSRCVKDYNGSK